MFRITQIKNGFYIIEKTYRNLSLISNFLFTCFQTSSPPIITHTAATPQDSPSTTLDDFPEFRYNVKNVTNEVSTINENGQGYHSSTDSITQKTSVS